MTDRIYTGRAADTLANGQPIAPGEAVSLDADAEQANQHLIDAGVLGELPQPDAKARKEAAKP